ncbi:hypothetical protein Dimus_035860, partial [Dionaea muscipula]
FALLSNLMEDMCEDGLHPLRGSDLDGCRTDSQDMEILDVEAVPVGTARDSSLRGKSHGHGGRRGRGGSRGRGRS